MRLNTSPRARRGPASSPHQKVRKAAWRVSGTGGGAGSDGLEASLVTGFNVGSSRVMVLERVTHATCRRLVGNRVAVSRNEGRVVRGTPNADPFGSSSRPHVTSASSRATLHDIIVPVPLYSLVDCILMLVSICIEYSMLDGPEETINPSQNRNLSFVFSVCKLKFFGHSVRRSDGINERYARFLFAATTKRISQSTPKAHHNEKN